MALARKVKAGVLAGAEKLGVFSAVAGSGWRQRRLLILCYHGISQKDEHRWSDLFVSKEFFADRLALIARLGYQVLSLESAIEALRHGELPPKSVAITFDDGFYDFRQHAIPALAEAGMPATLYLTTYYASRPYPIYNLVLSYLFWRGAGKSLDATGVGLSHSCLLQSVAERNQPLVNAYLRTAQAQDLSVEDRNEVAAQLANQLGVDFGELMALRMLQLMNSGEVSEAVEAGIDIQLHTHRHRTPIEREAFDREIRENREWISSEVGIQCNHFCYPSGGYHLEMLPWLRSQGVLSATTCDQALASKADDPLLLPRFLDSMHVSETEFAGWLSGLSVLLPHRRVYSPNY